MSRQLTNDQSPHVPFSQEWQRGDRSTPDTRMVIRRLLARRHEQTFGGGLEEDFATLLALETLIELREQLEHEIDQWVLFGLRSGMTLRQIAEPMP